MSNYNEDDYSYNGVKPRAFLSREDSVAHFGDKRYRGRLYERDEAFVRFVEACACLTDDQYVGANVDLRGALAGEANPQWQDLDNTLGGMRDTYRSMSEVTADMSAPKYKNDAFERQRVAEKLHRSSADPVFTGTGRLQTGEGEEDEDVGNGVVHVDKGGDE